MERDIARRLEETLSTHAVECMRSTKTTLQSGQVFNLFDLTVSWAGHVAELKKHTETGSGDLPYWGAHDLIAALIIREFTKDTHSKVDGELSNKVGAILEKIDNELVSFTEHDEFGCVIAVEENTEGRRKPDREWWWHRIPTHGPIRDDVRAYCNHSHH